MVTREATGQFRGEGPGEVEAMGRDRLEVERVCEYSGKTLPRLAWHITEPLRQS